MAREGGKLTPGYMVKSTVSGGCDKISRSAQVWRVTPSAVLLRSAPLRGRPALAAAGRAQFLSHYPYCCSVTHASLLVRVRQVSEKKELTGDQTA